MEGTILLYYVVIILVFVIAVLTAYNMSIHKKIQDLRTMNQKIANLTIVQDFMNVAGSDLSVDDKIKAINIDIVNKLSISSFDKSSLCIIAGPIPIEEKILRKPIITKTIATIP